jgi:CheY-like chemotaxis protein
MNPSNSPSFKILLVEDNPADAHLVERALRKSVFTPLLSVVEDGIEAMDFLRRRGAHEGARCPDLILLDLNIPGKEGHEVLGELRNDPEFKELPVIIYTSSSAPKDVKTSYRLGANAYVRKPTDIEEFFDVISSIESFWLKTALLPSPQR